MRDNGRGRPPYVGGSSGVEFGVDCPLTCTNRQLSGGATTPTFLHHSQFSYQLLSSIAKMTLFCTILNCATRREEIKQLRVCPNFPAIPIMEILS
jgi:hypothetical protein